VVSDGGKILVVEKPKEAELNRHLLLLVSSIFHECQHVVTDAFLNPSLDESVDHEATDASGCKSPAQSSAPQKKRTTPEHVGTTNMRGQVAGDSGFEWEDTVFGGRLQHLERKDMPPFLVSFAVSNR
jgi:hypothetical protein